MDNIDLATTRLYDKLEGAVSQDIYAVASAALNGEAARHGITKPVAVAGVKPAAASYLPKGVSVWVIAIIALLLVLKR